VKETRSPDRQFAFAGSTMAKLSPAAAATEATVLSVAVSPLSMRWRLNVGVPAPASAVVTFTSRSADPPALVIRKEAAVSGVSFTLTR
jgi:hypothetical protein